MAEFASGGAFGLLLGTLIGLSASPVVGTVVTALAALLGALLGLRRAVVPAGAVAPAMVTHQGAVIGFGLLCVVGILGGLFIRANGLLSPSVETRVHRWQAAGYTPDEARQIVAKLELGSGAAGGQAKAPAQAQPQAAGDKREGNATAQSVLFSDSDVSDCEWLSVNFASLDAAMQAFQHAGGEWARMAQTVQRQGGSSAEQLRRLQALRNARCTP
jgi:hypothetical protein